jgi:hypothetical protein
LRRDLAVDKRKVRRNQSLLFLFTAGMLAVTVLVQSGGGNDSTEEKKFISAGAVCDSALNKEAARRLENITGTEIFQEQKGASDSGAYSFLEVADTLAEDLETTDRKPARRLCHVYPGGMSGGALVIDFSWGTGMLIKGFWESGDPLRFKEIDALTFEDSANTAFPCPVDGKESAKGGERLLQARISVLGEDSGSVANHRAEALILHSVSVKMAEEMGCLKESGLPKKLNHLTLVPTKATKK